MDDTKNGVVVKMENLSDQEIKFVNDEMNVEVKSELPGDVQQNSTSSAIKQETEMFPVLEYYNQLDDNNAFHKREGMFECKKCRRLYADEDSIMTDEYQDVGCAVKKHDCSFCHYSSDNYRHFFTQKGDLIYYRSVIKKDKRPHQCHYCNKLFTNASSLKIHIRVHTKEKPYKCKECPAAFAHSGNLSSHVMTCHTKHLPYGCQICGRGFAHASYLKKKHSNSHKREAIQVQGMSRCFCKLK